MIKPDVLVVLLDSGLSRMLYLSNVDLHTLTGDAINTHCFQAEIVFDGLKETRDLIKWEAYSFDFMSQ
jgi:hypothetical protein